MTNLYLSMVKNPNRRVMSMGKTALCITLPSDWVKENRIVKGDLLVLTEEPAGLLLTKVI
jgi:phosphate uptake regulator